MWAECAWVPEARYTGHGVTQMDTHVRRTSTSNVQFPTSKQLRLGTAPEINPLGVGRWRLGTVHPAASTGDDELVRRPHLR
jgi:hypothetical protein